MYAGISKENCNYNKRTNCVRSIDLRESSQMHIREWQEACGFITDICDSVTDSGRTMHDLFNIITEDKNRIIYSWEENGRIVKLRRDLFAHNVAAVARMLVDIIPPNSKMVGLHLPNHHLWPVFYWAILMSGHIPVIINSRSDLFMYRNIKECRGIYIITKDKKYPFRIAPEILKGSRFETDLAYFDSSWEDETLFVDEDVNGDFRLVAHNGVSVSEQLLRLRYVYKEEQKILSPFNRKASLKLPFSDLFGFITGVIVYPCYGYEINIPKPGCGMVQYIMTGRSLGINVYCLSGKDSQELAGLITWKIERAFTREAPKYTAWLKGTGKVNDYRILSRFLNMSIKMKKMFFGRHSCCIISGDNQINDTVVSFMSQLGVPFSRCLCTSEAGLTAMDLNPDHEMRKKNSVGRLLNGVAGQCGPEGYLELTGVTNPGRKYTEEGTGEFGFPLVTRIKATIDRDGCISLEKNENPNAGTRMKPDPGVLEKVKEAYSIVLNKPAEIIDDDMDFFTDLGGDSLTYFLLLRHIEVMFGIKVRPDDGMFFATVRFAAETLRSYKINGANEVIKE